VAVWRSADPPGGAFSLCRPAAPCRSHATWQQCSTQRLVDSSVASAAASESDGQSLTEPCEPAGRGEHAWQPSQQNYAAVVAYDGTGYAVSMAALLKVQESSFCAATPAKDHLCQPAVVQGFQMQTKLPGATIQVLALHIHRLHAQRLLTEAITRPSSTLTSRRCFGAGPPGDGYSACHTPTAAGGLMKRAATCTSGLP
jgi:hypothetical protein